MFDGCKNLKEATLAGNFYAIGGNAIQGTFQHATSLTKIDLRQMTGNPNIFNATGNFNDIGVIKTIVLDNTSTSTGLETLTGTTSNPDNYLLLPSGATDLGTNIFSGLNKVEKLDLSRATSLTNIGATGLGASNNLEISLPTAQTVTIGSTSIAYTPATTLTLNANAFGAAGAGANYANIAATNATAA